MKENEHADGHAPDSGEEVGISGSIAAKHPSKTVWPILAAPTVGGRGKNTIRMELVVVACIRVHGDCFAFGSSFLLPASRDEFRALAKLRRQHTGAPLSLFGHADPVGDDLANKQLSGHRAESVYAVLLHDAARWEKLYAAAGQKEGWGTGAVRSMLLALGFKPGATAGDTKAAIEQYQTKNGLRVDGIAGPKTREKLFRAYMAFLWPERSSPADFLGGGRDAAGKVGVQGCGEFNPVMLFAKGELEEFQEPENHERRDAENRVNRRVLILLFRPGTTVSSEKWPCPRTNEGTEGCQKRFWSDAKKRRAASETRRTFGQTKDTFACRFYQRLVNESPCELRDGRRRKGRMTISFVLAQAGQVSTEYPKYLLRSTDGAYEKELTPKNDLVPSDEYLQLRFENLLPGREYMLRREDGPSIADVVFDNVPFDDIIDQERDTNSSLTDHDFALADLTISESFPFDWTA